MKCDKCGNEEALLLTRQNPKGEKGIFWCEKCTNTNVITIRKALEEALEPKLMLKYLGDGGYQFEREYANKLFKVGESYQVIGIYIDKYVTYFKIKDFECNGRFNSCLFESNQVMHDIIKGNPISIRGVEIESVYDIKYSNQYKRRELHQILIKYKTENRQISAIFKDIQEREKLSITHYNGEFVKSNRFSSRENQRKWIEKNSRKMFENGRNIYLIRKKIQELTLY